MYWSYLYGINKNNKLNLLTLESNDNLENLIHNYLELILDNYFSHFTNDFNFIFISKYSPDNFPYENKKEFIIKLNDFELALLLLKKYHLYYEKSNRIYNFLEIKKLNPNL